MLKIYKSRFCPIWDNPVSVPYLPAEACRILRWLVESIKDIPLRFEAGFSAFPPLSLKKQCSEQAPCPFFFPLLVLAVIEGCYPYRNLFDTWRNVCRGFQRCFEGRFFQFRMGVFCRISCQKAGDDLRGAVPGKPGTGRTLCPDCPKVGSIGGKEREGNPGCSFCLYRQLPGREGRMLCEKKAAEAQEKLVGGMAPPLVFVLFGPGFVQLLRGAAGRAAEPAEEEYMQGRGKYVAE